MDFFRILPLHCVSLCSFAIKANVETCALCIFQLLTVSACSLQYTLNEGDTGHEIDIFLLDERYNRDPLPCHVRRDYCEKLVLRNESSPKYAW